MEEAASVLEVFEVLGPVVEPFEGSIIFIKALEGSPSSSLLVITPR